MLNHDDYGQLLCHWCGLPAALVGPFRPYGPGGSNICFPCGMDHLAETTEAFNLLYNVAELLGPVVIGPNGPTNAGSDDGEETATSGD